MTINTHSLAEQDCEKKQQLLAAYITKFKPDVIAMQEVNQTAAAPKAGTAMAEGRKLLGGEKVCLKDDNYAAVMAAALRTAGLPYCWCWLPMKLGYGKYDEGLALFSRKPIAETDVVLLSGAADYTDWRTRYALGVRLGTDWFYSVHMGWWQDEQEPFARQWQRLEDALAPKQETGRIFLLGDFNSPAQIRHEGYDLLLAKGWQDTYVLAEEKDAGVTVKGTIDGWRDKLPEEELAKGLRLDYIWCSENITVKRSRCCCNDVNGRIISDHFGVEIEWEA